MSTFDYEFIFPSDTFAQDVYNACPIKDTTGGRQEVIEFKVSQIKDMFANTSLHLYKFSTLVTYEGKTYKVTLTNPNF